MPIRVTCPSCDSSYPVDDSQRGKTVRCRECAAPIGVPAAAAREEAVSSGPPALPARARSPQDDARPRRANRAKGGGVLLPLVAIAGALVVLFVLGLFAIAAIWLLRSGPAPAADNAALAQGDVLVPGAIPSRRRPWLRR